MQTAYIRCPHCGQRMRTHAHRQLHPLLKEMVAVCNNPKCLFTAGIHVEITRQIHPSLISDKR